MTTRNPLEWGLARVGLGPRDLSGMPEQPVPRSFARAQIRTIGVDDLRAALRAGFDDFIAARTDVVILCILYPLIGVGLARFTFGYGVLPMLFPLAAGFALLGPLFAVGLNEMSRRRELGRVVGWADAFGVARSRAFGPILLLGVVLLAIFLAWLIVAATIYNATLGPRPPASLSLFVHDLFTTGPGWAMIVVGVGVGFLFAVLVLSISVVSFPLLLDREVGVDTAIATSFRAARQNARVLAIWGLIIAAALLVGSIPLFLGLAVVLPVLGHATWHLYRRIVPV